MNLVLLNFVWSGFLSDYAHYLDSDVCRKFRA